MFFIITGFVCNTTDLAASNSDFGGVNVESPMPTGSELTFVGAVATFFCSPGYSLVGDQSRTCTLGVGWNGTNPVCSELRLIHVHNYVMELA